MASEFEETSRALSVDELRSGFPHVPVAGGAMMAQAAVVCLDHQGHKSGVRFRVIGDLAGSFVLTWCEAIDDKARRFWRDMDEAAEQGAYGIAILLIRALTGLTMIERSCKGTGFDWWLGNEDNLFQAKARLEVSGILRGSLGRINSRLKARIAQTRQSDDLNLPAYVVVVEFGGPRAKVVER